MSHDDEMDAAMARIGVLRLRLDEKEAELTDLKSTADQFKIENSILIKEINRLLVGVDSLMTNPTSRLLRTEREDNARLNAQVDSLKRAGDLMLKYACANVTYPCYATMAKDWNAAKENKQS